MSEKAGQSKLPGIAFARIASTGRTVAIRLGESRYLYIDTDKNPDELNRQFGVTPAQARAMLAGVLIGWRARLANPELYGPNGELLDETSPEPEDQDRYYPESC